MDSSRGKVLVTGATGFTGSHMVRTLVQRGYQVRALVRSPERLGLLSPEGVELVPGDLKDAESLARACQGVEGLFHVAALYRQEGVSTQEFYAVNADGTRKLLEIVAESGVRRVLHCSTVGVQGEISNPPAREDAPYNPGDHYQRSKMLGEQYALEFFRSGKLSGVVVRPAGIYGPGDRRFLKLFRSVARGSFWMVGGGDVLYQMTYVQDLVDGMILAYERAQVTGEVFTIAGAEYTTIAQLVEKVAEALEVQVKIRHVPLWPVMTVAWMCEKACKLVRVEPPIYRRRLDFFTKDRAFDISKAREVLGYEPRVPLDQGLRITAQWYREKGWLT